MSHRKEYMSGIGGAVIVRAPLRLDSSTVGKEKAEREDALPVEGRR